MRAPRPRWHQPKSREKTIVSLHDGWVGRAHAASSVGLLVIAVYGLFFSPLAAQIEQDLRSQAIAARQDLIELKDKKLSLERALEADRIAAQNAKRALASLQAEMRSLRGQVTRERADRSALTRNVIAKTTVELQEAFERELDRYAIIAAYSRDLPVALAWIEEQLRYLDLSSQFFTDVLGSNLKPIETWEANWARAAPKGKIPESWTIDYRDKTRVSPLATALLNVSRIAGRIDPLDRSRIPSTDKARVMDLFFKETSCASGEGEITAYAIITRLTSLDRLQTLLPEDARKLREKLVRNASKQELLNRRITVCPHRALTPDQISKEAKEILETIDSLRKQPTLLSP